MKKSKNLLQDLKIDIELLESRRNMLGEKIRKLRLYRGESQETYAEVIGVTRQTIANWEKNKTVPNLLEAKKIADSFYMTLDEFLAFEEEGMERVELGPDTYYVFGKVKIDSMGRVKIPVEARRVFALKANDELIVLGDRERGIELITADVFWSARLLKESDEAEKFAFCI